MSRAASSPRSRVAAWAALAASVTLACACSSPEERELDDLSETERSSLRSSERDSSRGPAATRRLYRDDERVVAEGDGWRVTTRGGQPVETFGSSDRPVGFEPADPPAAKGTPREAPREAAPASPWVAAPESEAAAGEGKRTPLKTEATGVDLVPGQCGPVPVARYGLDWRPDEEWKPGQGPRPDGWRLREPPRLPPVPTPEGTKPGAKPVLQEKGVPSGSADPDAKGTWQHAD